MPILALVLLLLALGITIVVGELWRAPRRATTWSPGKRVVVMGALGALMMVAVSPSLLLSESRDLPTERPEEPWRRGGMGCGESDAEAMLMMIAAAVYFAVRGGPAIGGAIGAATHHPGPRREPDGRFALRAATSCFAVVGGLVALRVAACGAAPDEFTTYGAITPAGAAGWRVDTALALTLGEPNAITEGDPLAEELKHHGGSHVGLSHGPSTTARAGLQAWIGDEPVLFHREQGTGRIVGSRVRHRDPEMIPHERRPHYAEWPQVARLDGRHLVIVGHATGGGTLAVKVSDNSLDAVSATYADAGLVVRPQVLPWLLGFVIGIAGLALARRANRRDDAATRMFAAWILLEATAILLFGNVAAFGVAGS